MATEIILKPAVGAEKDAGAVVVLDVKDGPTMLDKEAAASMAVILLEAAGFDEGIGEVVFEAIKTNRQFLAQDEVEQTVVVKNDETGHVLGTSHEIDDLIDWIAWAQDEPMIPDPAEVFLDLFEKVGWPEDWPDANDPAWEGYSLTYWFGVVPGGVEIIGTAIRP